MIAHQRQARAAMLIALCGAAAVAADSPHDWLDRMSNAVQTSKYEGTVVRIVDGDAEALKVVHTVTEGVIHEKVVAQDGNGLEIIRNGNEVHCILPEDKSVLVEEWNDQSTLFSTLPSSRLRFGNEYDVKIVGEERIAGREAMEIAIKPHDEFRYEHRVWLDIDTGFPLQTQLIGDDGAPLEQVKFADIRFASDIQSSALESSYSTDSYRWYNAPRRRATAIVDSAWQSDDLPIGFRLVSTQSEIVPGSEDAVTHIMYSDGLANVSVFVSAEPRQKIRKRSRIGASNSFSTVSGGYAITAMGEVPAITVERIASSMRMTR